MRKKITLGLVAMLVLSLLGCGDVDASDVETTNSELVSEQTESVSDEIADESTKSILNDSQTEEESNTDDLEENDSEEGLILIEDTESDAEDSTELNAQTEDILQEDDEVIPEPEYSISELSMIMYVATTANVRSGPDQDDKKIGTVIQNDEVVITGKVDNGWYRIDYNGEDGFVKGSLLTEEKAFVQEVAPASSDSEEVSMAAGSSENSEPSVHVTVPDEGDTEGNLVWIPTKGGKKYHSKSTCSNMDGPMQVTLERAEENGFTPCKRCH
ncbi:SH3 domain-containing protein [Butyrivibrio sp. MC2013]|uniref:SH3 domain-containing protein n=1 Tax=Butyrivibrio sp. MC2013 TaxID=1280686 RepID=UPI00041C0D09|nr:SH3 domain-containing protein [Butyrivibrio sp. MC2013]